MTTSWTQSASEIVRSALEHMQVIDAVQTVSPEDQSICLRALDGLLKELPTFGYLWPEYKIDQSVSWSGGTPSYVTLPTDFLAFPFVRRSDGVQLVEFDTTEWLALTTTERAATAAMPTNFYLSGSTLLLYPIPTADPVIKLSYQSKNDDAGGSSVPDFPQFWMNSLPFGVAYECCLKFGVPIDIRAEIKARWGEKLDKMLKYSTPLNSISFEVRD